MIDVRLFHRTDDVEALQSWRKHFGLEPIDIDELPELGLMATFEGRPMAYVSLVFTNAKFAMLETICVNPETDPDERQPFIAALVEHAESITRESGYRRLVAFPELASLVGRAKALGFTVHPKQSTIVTKEIV